MDSNNSTIIDSPKISIVNTKNSSYCLIEKDLISNYIKNYGYWELHLIHIYQKIIQPNFVVLDAGANIGYHTVQFSLLANQGTVYAFEPQNFIYNVLVSNITVNQLSHKVKHFKLGLSNDFSSKYMSPIEEQIFSSDCVNYGGRGLVNNLPLDEKDKIDTITIDSLNLKQLDFIKMDIQGSEKKALKGGIKTITNFLPVIFLENSLKKKNDQEILKTLYKIGYISFRYSPKELNSDIILFHPKNNSKIFKIIEDFNTQNPDYKLIKE